MKAPVTADDYAEHVRALNAFIALNALKTRDADLFFKAAEAAGLRYAEVPADIRECKWVIDILAQAMQIAYGQEGIGRQLLYLNRGSLRRHVRKLARLSRRECDLTLQFLRDKDKQCQGEVKGAANAEYFCNPQDA